MDHNQAIQGSFPERYILGELTAVERDEFEVHYFDCTVCAADVHVGAVFVDNTRALLRSEEATGPVSPRFAGFGLPFRMAAMASVCLLGLVGYQNVVTIPSLHAGGGGNMTDMARIVPRISLVGMGSRAAAQAVAVPSGKDAAFELEIPGGPEFVSYVCQILDQADEVISMSAVPPDLAKDAFTLEVPGSQLKPGAYKIVVIGNKAGGASQELSRVPLLVK